MPLPFKHLTQRVRELSSVIMVRAKKYVLERHFEGFPKPTDLKIIEEELPPIKDGEFLAEAVYLSVDPYQRAYEPNLQIGTTFIGTQVAKITQSKNPNYPVGKYIAAEFGWRTHTIADEKSVTAIHVKHKSSKINTDLWIIPDFEGLPLSLALGILGMPGVTAYFGFLEICQPKPGETVVISGAAGAVGTIVGQIAKIKGCKVIGITGSDEKGKSLIKNFNFDGFVNYKNQDFEGKLAEAAPQGIDCYFDNVGGPLSTKVLNQMNPFGRISICGVSSGYNDRNAAKADAVQFPMVFKQLKMEGFIFNRWSDRWYEGIEQNKKWIKEGKLKYHETVTEGFENMFKAFLDLLQGKSVGKSIVKV